MSVTDYDPQHAQDLIRLTLRPLKSGYPPMNRLKRAQKSLLRAFQMRVEKTEFLPRAMLDTLFFTRDRLELENANLRAEVERLTKLNESLSRRLYLGVSA